MDKTRITLAAVDHARALIGCALKLMSMKDSHRPVVETLNTARAVLSNAADIERFEYAGFRGYVLKSVFLDEVDPQPWNPTAEADAIAKATAPAEEHPVHRMRSNLAQLLGRRVDEIVAWEKEGCPYEKGRADRRFDLPKVVAWLEERAAGKGRLERKLTKHELSVVLNVPESEVERWIGLGCPVVDGTATRPMRLDVSLVVEWLERRAERDAEAGLQPVTIEMPRLKTTFFSKNVEELKAAFARYA